MIRRFTHSKLYGFKDGTLDYIEIDGNFNVTSMVFFDGRSVPCSSVTLGMCLEQVKEGNWSEIIHEPEIISSMVKYPVITQNRKS